MNIVPAMDWWPVQCETHLSPEPEQEEADMSNEWEDGWILIPLVDWVCVFSLVNHQIQIYLFIFSMGLQR